MQKLKVKLNPPQILVLGFAILIMIGAFLLMLPVALESGEGLSFLNALFTATSAVCVTGLVVFDTADTFSLFGEVVILNLIQIGGLGFMTYATFLFILLGRKITYKNRLLLKDAFNDDLSKDIVILAKRILIFSLIIEAIGGILLSVRFSYDMDMDQAIYFGFFHAISNFNNAGFDLMGGYKSLSYYVDDPIVVLTTSFLIILGGLGFIVLNELYEYRKTRKLSLHTKIVLSTTSIFLIAATMLILVFEYGNAKTLGQLSGTGKILGAFFHSVTPRTAGSSTLSVTDLTDTTLFLTIFLMFIGAGSGSTAGGIKISTFTVLFATIFSQLKGKQDVELFQKRIVPETILKAFTIASSGLIVVFLITFLLSITEKNHLFIAYLFEATSALGTVGLSMDLTPDLSIFGRTFIIVAMFIGRLGPLIIGFTITRRMRKKSYRYVKGNVMIG